MTDFQISDHLLSKECDEIAQEIFDEVMGEAAPDEDAEFHRETMDDRAHESADGHQWVIYNHKALMLCAHCDTSLGGDFLSDIGMPEDPDLYKIACMIAFGEMRGRIGEKLAQLIEEWEPADSDEDEQEDV
jgi:hypothetical protein